MLLKPKAEDLIKEGVFKVMDANQASPYKFGSFRLMHHFKTVHHAMMLKCNVRVRWKESLNLACRN